MHVLYVQSFVYYYQYYKMTSVKARSIGSSSKMGFEDYPSYACLFNGTRAKEATDSACRDFSTTFDFIHETYGDEF